MSEMNVNTAYEAARESARSCAREGCENTLEGRRSTALYCSEECKSAARPDRSTATGRNRAQPGGQPGRRPYKEWPVTGRTYYWAKDAAWYDRENVAELIVDFGALGVAVLDWLCCHAKVINEGGYVKSGYVAIAKAIGELGRIPDVMAAVALAAKCGCLDEFANADGGAMTFTCRISGWEADQGTRKPEPEPEPGLEERRGEKTLEERTTKTTTPLNHSGRASEEGERTHEMD